jgi:hypothetical protein
MPLKTPLPENLNIHYAIDAHTVARKLNQIIAYLAELTEVMEDYIENNMEDVEGKQEIFEQRTARILDADVLQMMAPTLKEQLLYQIANCPVYTVESGITTNTQYMKKEDVEAIINRLIP